MQSSKYLIIPSFLLLAHLCNGQNLKYKDFKKYNTPNAKNIVYKQLDTTSSLIYVKNVEGKLVFTLNSQVSGKMIEKENGRILSLDFGEWSGGLFYLPDDSGVKQYLVDGRKTPVHDNFGNFGWGMPKNDPVFTLMKGRNVLLNSGNITDMIKSEDGGFYYLRYYSTMNGLIGNLMILKIYGNSFQSDILATIPSKPIAITNYNHSTYLISTDGIYRFKYGELKHLETAVDWKAVWPTSIAVVNKKIVVGIRGGYIQIDAKRGHSIFFIFNNRQPYVIEH